jgi:hypothetical protein
MLVSGIGTDLLVYSMITPVAPFQLQKLGYNGISNLVGWLLFAFVSRVFSHTFHVLTNPHAVRRPGSLSVLFAHPLVISLTFSFVIMVQLLLYLPRFLKDTVHVKYLLFLAWYY